MQHASASPQTAINKINKVTAENNGRPSLMDLLTASDVEDSNQSFVGSSQQSSTKPVTPFTFESRPLPPLNTANTQPKSDIPGRNTQSLLQPKGKPETVSYLNDPSKAGNSSANSDDHAEATGAKEALALDGSSDMKQKTLNLRTNMREPIPNSTSIPRTSITRRAAPYKVPTINERESLRSSRTPQFRARPLDPKVFTGAGDVGVPRIRKLPLTVPVSPVFTSRAAQEIPVPFQLATQRRAEIHMHQHGSGAAAQTTSVGARRPSRLAGLAPLRSSIPSGHTSGAIRKSQFKPTVPISPKLGQRVPVRALQPTRFLLKKSTKELTQPHEFRFHSDQRAREREQFEQSAKKREQELLELKQKAPELHRQREQRMRVRESMERSFHAGPIKHYQPITIHKATKPLTKPMSPMIGEKRKRHEMETQYLEQQQHTTHLQGSYGDIQTNASYAQSADDPQGSYLPELNAVVEPEVYREFEEAKILQEQHRALQEQLTRQERRQLELANSYHATIHQPPIRLSFPLDPAFEALQTSDSRANSSESADAEQPNAEQPNGTSEDQPGG
ncbi:hypothetical protein BC939DRAFT_478388 [Gamsiella multidivaricata]|uniref:uncharacterized protein n=1 Tax=Gamsiella multidivaricata TaxID=101098 RepID=UPI0022203D3B|nr:uncharacterized protein BC939DRAFT_478388 [Gamsiella multidivaricata]KAI7821408.1 hypothetical protein BC939DRAFT_478388 [Gamsiella multidivaricata]